MMPLPPSSLLVLLAQTLLFIGLIALAQAALAKVVALERDGEPLPKWTKYFAATCVFSLIVISAG